LFPGVLPNFNQPKTSMSLTVSAARIELASFEARLANMQIRLIVSDETLTEIARQGVDPRYGARPLQKTIEMQIEYPISKAVLKGKIVARDTIEVVMKDGAIAFEK
jgi:ATP-dependent Clp protease ATP-binding subunit ClpB